MSTDDFLGASPNNTNLALLGIAGQACYGYLQYVNGDAAGANTTWQAAGANGAAWVAYAWVPDGKGGGHARMQFQGTPGAATTGAAATSWSQKYNAIWLRVLGLDNLLPGQAGLLAAETAFYATQLNPLGLPLTSAMTSTKGDWSVVSGKERRGGA